MKLDQIVSRDPEVLGGTLVFAGTRVPADSLIGHLKAGDTLDDFLEGFPTVSREQAEAFLDLALHTILPADPGAHDARAA